MSKLDQNVIAVLDIGKTNVKFSIVACDSQQVLLIQKMSNRVLTNGLYPHADVEGIWQWYCDCLKSAASQFVIRFLGCTTHGATGVCINKDGIALPVVDYEAELYEEVEEQYLAVRPDYQETFSPNLSGAGLNLGRQVYWLSQQFPESFEQVDAFVMYPQYWGWRLSGRAVSEVTSLGCHTDLWNPSEGCLSSLVTNMGWSHLFPPLLKAGESLGTVKPNLAADLGLPENCQVINGVHDSNASLVPYLLDKKQPLTVISSGTWVIMAGVGLPLHGLQEQHDMLVNVNVLADAVPSIRFMGGREWDHLRGASECDSDDLAEVLRLGVYALPAFSNQGGPFRDCEGKIIGPHESLTPSGKTALASLYCALVCHYCLGCLGSHNDIYIEGSLATNEVYKAVLSTLRPDEPLFISKDSTGTTQGVVMSITKHTATSNGPRQYVVGPSNGWKDDLLAYSQRWFEMVDIMP